MLIDNNSIIYCTVLYLKAVKCWSLIDILLFLYMLILALQNYVIHNFYKCILIYYKKIVLSKF